jgi:hypothetical protein
MPEQKLAANVCAMFPSYKSQDQDLDAARNILKGDLLLFADRYRFATKVSDKIFETDPKEIAFLEKKAQIVHERYLKLHDNIAAEFLDSTRATLNEVAHEGIAAGISWSAPSLESRAGGNTYSIFPHSSFWRRVGEELDPLPYEILVVWDPEETIIDIECGFDYRVAGWDTEEFTAIKDKLWQSCGSILLTAKA